MRVEGELRADVAGSINLGTPGAFPLDGSTLTYSDPDRFSVPAYGREIRTERGLLSSASGNAGNVLR